MEIQKLQKLQKQVKRLQIFVGILFFLFLTSVGFTIYGTMQIRTVASVVDKIPSYKEVREDIKTLKGLINISEKKVPEAYNFTKKKAIQGLQYSKEKAEQGYQYSKEKTGELIQYFKEKAK